MNLSKYIVTALSVVGLQTIAHVNSSGAKKHKNSGLTVHFVNHLSSVVAEQLYKGLDDIVVVRPEIPKEGTTYLDDYYVEDYSHSDVVKEGDTHYFNAILNYVLTSPLNPNEICKKAIAFRVLPDRDMSLEEKEAYVQSERTKVFSELIKSYTSFESKYMTGTYLTELQLYTPNTVNTAIQALFNANAIHVDVDYQVQQNAMETLRSRIVNNATDFDRNVNSQEAEGNAGIARHVGSMIDLCIPQVRQNFKFKRTDFIIGDGEDKRSGSASEIFGDTRLPNMAECNVDMEELFESVAVVDAAIAGTQPTSTTSMLLSAIQKSVNKVSIRSQQNELVDMYCNTNTRCFIGVFDSLSDSIDKSLNKVQKEFDLVQCYKDWLQICGSTTFTKSPDIRIENIKVKKNILVFAHHFVAHNILKRLDAVLGKHGYSLLNALIFPAYKIKGSTLLTHLMNTFEEGIEFPLIDNSLQEVVIKDLTNATLHGSYASAFDKKHLTLLSKAVATNVTRLTTSAPIFQTMDQAGKLIHQDDLAPDAGGTLLLDEVSDLLVQLEPLAYLDVTGTDLFISWGSAPVFISNMLRLMRDVNGMSDDNAEFFDCIEQIDYFIENWIAIEIDKFPKAYSITNLDGSGIQYSYPLNKLERDIEVRIKPHYLAVVKLVGIPIPPNRLDVYSMLDYISNFYYIHSGSDNSFINPMEGKITTPILLTAYISNELNKINFKPTCIGEMGPSESEIIIKKMENLSQTDSRFIYQKKFIEDKCRSYLDNLYVSQMGEYKSTINDIFVDTFTAYCNSIVPEEYEIIRRGRKSAEGSRLPFSALTMEQQESLLTEQVVTGDGLLRIKQILQNFIGKEVTKNEAGFCFIDDTPLFRIHYHQGSNVQISISFISDLKGEISCTISPKVATSLKTLLGEYSY